MPSPPDVQAQRTRPLRQVSKIPECPRRREVRRRRNGVGPHDPGPRRCRATDGRCSPGPRADRLALEDDLHHGPVSFEAVEQLRDAALGPVMIEAVESARVERGARADGIVYGHDAVAGRRPEGHLTADGIEAASTTRMSTGSPRSSPRSPTVVPSAASRRSSAVRPPTRDLEDTRNRPLRPGPLQSGGEARLTSRLGI